MGGAISMHTLEDLQRYVTTQQVIHLIGKAFHGPSCHRDSFVGQADDPGLHGLSGKLLVGYCEVPGHILWETDILL